MNQSQIKHALARANAIRSTKQAAAKKAFDNKVRSLSLDEKLKALKAGKFSISKNTTSWRSSLEEYLTFHDAVPFDHIAYQKDVDAITASYDKLVDELVLGDQTRALELLRAFERM